MTGGDDSLVLIGLMGAGKTSIGRKLAKRLDLPFIDADEEIVEAAGCSIPDIFEIYGEPAFRDVEERVIRRLLDENPCVLATGGGAFMNPRIRDAITQNALSIWLKADLDVLVQRTSKRTGRPLLKGSDPRQILGDLMTARYPIYALADLVVETGNESVNVTLESIMTALGDHLTTANGAQQQ